MSRLKRTVFVSGFLPETEPEELYQYFVTFGAITTVQIPKDRNTGKRKTFGFVEYAEDENEIAGRVLRVMFARAPQSRAPDEKAKPVWAEGFKYQERTVGLDKHEEQTLDELLIAHNTEIRDLAVEK